MGECANLKLRGLRIRSWLPLLSVWGLLRGGRRVSKEKRRDEKHLTEATGGLAMVMHVLIVNPLPVRVDLGEIFKCRHCPGSRKQEKKDSPRGVTTWQGLTRDIAALRLGCNEERGWVSAQTRRSYRRSQGG